MLESLAVATAIPGNEVEILCSWNGEKISEQNIVNRSGYEFLIASRDPYHFSSNMNQLAQHANGDVLAFLNDDLLLDPGSLDAGLSCLSNDLSTLCVGALLRKPDGTLQHGGMAFDCRHTPYHCAEGIRGVVDVISRQPPYEVPCVTGALVLTRKSTFNLQTFEEGYQRCGEDVQFSLDLREKFQGKVMLCPGMSAVHIESSTRIENNEAGNTSEDLVRMRTRRRLFLEQASREQLKVELSMATREQAYTKEELANRCTGSHLQTLERERDYWKREAQLLQLETLRLQDCLQRQQDV